MPRNASCRIAALAAWSALVAGPLALPACNTLAPRDRPVQVPQPITTTTSPWLAPPLPEPGEQAPLGPVH